MGGVWDLWEEYRIYDKSMRSERSIGLTAGVWDSGD